MTTPSIAPLNDEEMDELAAGWVLGDLSHEEEVRWHSIPADAQRNTLARMEIAASKVYLTLHDLSPEPQERMPLGVREKILRASLSIDASEPLLENEAPSTHLPVYRHGVSWREQVSWILTLAACITAMCAWLPSLTQTSSWNSGLVVDGNINQNMSPKQNRDKLLLENPDSLLIQWEVPSGQLPNAALGDVVWNSATQTGYMTFNQLPKNDPTKEQYQLWIIDPLRDSKPVDGGVFDIVSDSTSIIPFRAKLRVEKPTLFAVTIEKPGGVVVSDQSRLPLLAKVVDR